MRICFGFCYLGKRMRRLELHLDSRITDGGNKVNAVVSAKDQGYTLKADTLRGVALEIRDELKLKKCIRVGFTDQWGKEFRCDTFIFTEL